jgi:DNA-binding NtrC family response regulator
MVKSATLSTRLIEGAGAHLELEGAEIQVTGGPDRGTKIALSVDSVLIGSSPGCDLVLHDPTVSSRHAEISIDGSSYMIRDLKSTNGLAVGAVRIDRAPLADGLRVRLGGTTLTVRALGKRISLPLGQAGRFGGLIAQSVKMRAFVAMIEQLAASELTVLIEGETGTGKELAAEALHANSPRRTGPFVVLDCGSMAHSLMAAELFGYERGAFTGADQPRAGLLEEAEGGTLFLDEIGELPLEVQPMLLGAIERRRSRRIGGRRDVTHDVRVVAATNRNLAEESRAKRFREDLYHRLSVARVRIPPLRERAEDVLFLADQFAAEAGVPLMSELLLPFKTYEWPGNVRELRNTVMRLGTLRASSAAEMVDKAFSAEAFGGSKLYSESGGLRSLPEARRLISEQLEKQYVAEALARCEGNLTRAADLAGISRQAFTRLAQKHGLHGVTPPEES